MPFSFEWLERVARRSQELLGRQDLHPALAAMAGRVDPVVGDYLEKHAAVRDAATAAGHETAQAMKAIAPLKREYDVVRVAVMANAPHEVLGPAASTLTTPDDLLGAAEELEGVVESHQGEDWAAGLLGRLSELLDAGAREYGEGVLARSDLQKAQAKRRQAAALLNAALVDLRRVVRAVYGSRSREYHSLKTYRGRSPEEVEPEEAEDGPAVP